MQGGRRNAVDEGGANEGAADEIADDALEFVLIQDGVVLAELVVATARTYNCQKKNSDISALICAVTPKFAGSKCLD